MKISIRGVIPVDSLDNKECAITVNNGFISKMNFSPVPGQMTGQNLVLENTLIFPALINSHDHLEFNCFPQLGQQKYVDYPDWANDIHSNYKSTINNILDIPLHNRLKTGIYKNFFCGITQVAHHGLHYPQLGNETVNIINNCINLHSIKMEVIWQLKLNFRKVALPAVIHIGEGVSDDMKGEIDTLIKWNLFKRDIIGVHGISMSKKQAKHFKALIWCPDSNIRLYNETAQIEDLKYHTNILFGTDSTLSASWNFWEQLRLARDLKKLNDQELFDAITTTAIKVWGLQSCSKIKEGESADFVIARKKLNNKWDSFYAINPEDILLIINKGNLVYFDESIKGQIEGNVIENFKKVLFNGFVKFVRCNDSLIINNQEINFK